MLTSEDRVLLPFASHDLTFSRLVDFDDRRLDLVRVYWTRVHIQD